MRELRALLLLCALGCGGRATETSGGSTAGASANAPAQCSACSFPEYLCAGGPESMTLQRSAASNLECKYDPTDGFAGPSLTINCETGTACFDTRDCASLSDVDADAGAWSIISKGDPAYRCSGFDER